MKRNLHNICMWKKIPTSYYRNRIDSSMTYKLQATAKLLKVTMNKLCARLFIIIFIDVYSESEYIPTVTNFASILANDFYFLRKITALRPSVLNF